MTWTSVKGHKGPILAYVHRDCKDSTHYLLITHGRI